MKTLITNFVAIFILLTTTMGTATASNFFFDRKWENNLQVSKVKYEQSWEGMYIKTKKTDYSYDTEKRITEEQVSEWNEMKNEWMPTYHIIYTYDMYNTIELSKWDEKSKSYKAVENKMEYLLNKDNELISLTIADKYGNSITKFNNSSDLSNIK